MKSPQIPKLDGWAVVPSTSRQGRAAGAVALTGRVYGYPDQQRHPDGKRIVTTRVVDFRGRIVVTKSGTQYRLGRIEPDYRRWLRQHRPLWDWRQPFRVIDSPEDVARFERERAPLLAADALEDYLRAGARPAVEA